MRIKAMNNKRLKQAICVDMARESKQEVKRYVIEDLKDLNKFFKAFKGFDILNVKENLINALNEGRVILLTDPHPLSGVNTYCYQHPKGLMIEK